jgi:hypothetical protein
MMTPEQFEQKLRELLTRKPYRTVRVLWDGGGYFDIDDPQYVARDGGGGAYRDAEGKIYLFDYRDVADFVEAPSEVTS